MSKNNINIRVQTQAKQATSTLNGLTDGFKKLGRTGKTTTKSMSALVNSLGGVKRIIGSLSIYKLGEVFSGATKASMDIRESVHMFNVSLGDMAVMTGKAVDELSELSGMDRIKMLDTVGEYNLLARSMGMVSKNAQTLSVNSNKLALDLSALTNREYTKVSEDIRSGLIGQAKTMYKYGVDVTEASIKQEALNQGLTKSVRHMSQAEKMALRYSVMIKQTGLSHGDFTKTIDSGANQIRIIKDRLLSLSRSIGTIFLPIMEKILPYIGAFVKVLNEAARALSRFLGYTGEFEKAIDTPSDFGLSDLSEDAEESTKKIKKLKSQLMGFDEINLYTEQDDPNPLDEIDGGTGQFDLSGYDNMMDSMNQKTDSIFGKMMKQVDRLKDAFDRLRKSAKPTTDAIKKLWNEGLAKLANFSGRALISFYEKFLKPVGVWVLGEKGLPRLFNLINDMLMRIDWEKLLKQLERLFEALAVFAKFTFTAVIDFVEYALIPLGEWVLGTGLGRLADVLSRIIEAINWDAINGGLIEFWKALTKLNLMALEGIMWLIENILEPLAIWTIDVLGLKLLELFTTTLETLARVLEVLKPTWTWFWEDVIIPLGKAIGEKLIKSIDNLIEKLERFADWAEENPEKVNEMAQKIIKFGAAFMGLRPIVGLAGGLLKKFIAFKGIKSAFDFLNTDFSKVGQIGSDISKGVASIPGKASVSGAIPKTAAAQAIGMKIVDKPITAPGIIAPETVGTVQGIMGELSNVFKLGGVKIAAIVAGIALLAYAIYDNWEEIVELGKTLWDNVLKPVIDELGKMFTFLWEDVIQPVWEALKPALKALFELFSSIFGRIIDLLNYLIPIISEKFGPILKDVIDMIKGVLGPVLEVLVGIVRGALKGFEGFFTMLQGIINLDVEQFFEGLGMMLEGLWDMVKAIITKLPGLLWKLIKSIWKFWTEIVPKILSAIKDLFSDIGSAIWKKLKSIGKTLWEKITDWFKNIDLLQMAKDKLSDMKKAFDDFSLSDWASSKFSGMNPFSKNVTQTVGLSYASLPQLAGGGLVDTGQMFIANEAGPEMVGKFGSKTGVVNNDQIVSAITEGVYKAVLSAMGESQKGDGGDVALTLDGRELGRVLLPKLNGESKRMGYKPILEY